jgi:hypothetical protein
VADKTIDAIPAAGALSASDIFMLLQSGIEAQRSDLAALRTWLNSVSRAGDVITGNLGVGASGAERLNVAGNLTLSNAAYNFVQVVSGTTTGHFSAGEGSSVQIRAVSNSALDLFTNNSFRARLDAAGLFSIGIGTATTALHVNGPIRKATYTVATLPAAATVGAGTETFATDSNATLAVGHGNIDAAGGSNFVPVYSDGTNWRIG